MKRFARTLWRVRGIVGAVALCIVCSAQAVEAAYYTTNFAYYGSDFRIHGEVGTARDPWEGEGYYWYFDCECYLYQEGWVQVNAQMVRPNGSVWGSDYRLNRFTASFGGILRPGEAGVWSLQSQHWGIIEWYDVQGYYTGEEWGYLGYTHPFFLTRGSQVAVDCTVPDGESTWFAGWDPVLSSLAQWNQQLWIGWPPPTTPITFAGRTVFENTGNGAYDSCWFPGSMFDEQLQLSGSNWMVQGDEVWEPDYVGWTAGPVLYYQVERPNRDYPMPCESRIPQRMTISCGGPSPTYHNGVQSAWIGVDQVGSEKGGQLIWRSWP